MKLTQLHAALMSTRGAQMLVHSAYGTSNKDTFHLRAVRVLRSMAGLMPEGTRVVHHKGGPAVIGEVILRAPDGMRFELSADNRGKARLMYRWDRPNGGVRFDNAGVNRYKLLIRHRDAGEPSGWCNKDDELWHLAADLHDAFNLLCNINPNESTK